MSGIVKNIDRWKDVLENKERFELYGSEKPRRRIKPVYLELSYKQSNVLEIKFNAKEGTVNISYLPEKKSVLFSLKNFEYLLEFITKSDLKYGCNISTYTDDGILINLRMEEETILMIKNDITTIFLNKRDLFLMNDDLLYYMIGEMRNKY